MSDYILGATIYKKFSTRSFSTGAPTTLAGTPAVSVYEENNTTQITSGVTLTVDYDSVTGMHQVAIAATGGNGYEVGKDYAAVITTGTVGGVSVVGETLFNFSIEKSALGADAITAAKIADNAITTDQFADGTITAAKIASNAISAAKIATDAITAAKIAANAIGASELATDAASEIGTAVWATAARTLTANTNLNDPTAAAIADAVLDEALSGHTTAGSLGKAVADIETDATAILADTDELQSDDIPATLATIASYIDTEVAAIKAVTDNLPDSGALTTLLSNVSDILTDTATTIPGLISGLNNVSAAQVATEISDALNSDAQAEPTGVPSATAALATKIGFIYLMMRNQVTVSATKKTFHDDAGNPEFEKDLSDDGTTYTETEVNAI